MPKLDLSTLPVISKTGYPGALADIVRGRSYQRLAAPGGLTQFGVNLCRVAPGSASSQRHWHEKEDEFVVMLEGELILVEEGSEQVMRPGDCATFKAGVANGHHFVNRADKDGVFVVVGTNLPNERAYYPDVDLLYKDDETGSGYFRKDGTPY